MRRLALAPLAALLLAPAGVHAQAAAALRAFSVSGCVSGALRYDAGATPVFGQVACFTGSATLGPAPAGALSRFVLDGTLAARIAPEFSGPDVTAVPGGTVRFTYDAPGCPACAGGGVLEGRPSFAVGQTAPQAFRAFLDGSAAAIDAASIRDLRIVPFDVEYQLPGAVAGTTDYARGGLVFTATPEPATLALAAGGVVVLGAGARRRRRA